MYKRWSTQDIFELANAIVALEDDPAVPELLDKLESGELEMSETAESLRIVRLIST